MVFFRDFAYTALVKKYNVYIEELKKKCRKVQSCLLKFSYMSKQKRKKNTIRLIQNYMHSKLAA